MTADLEKMLSPASIAIVGASEDANKLGGRPLKFLQDKGYAGTIYPINPKHREIGGLACYPDIDALPEAADLAIVAPIYPRN